MRRYNDYVEIVRGYLRNYDRLQAVADNLDKEIALTRVTLYPPKPTAPIAQYGEKVGRGTSDLNNVEREANKIIEYERRIAEMTNTRDEIRLVLYKLDRALAALTPTERGLVEGKYKEGRYWPELADAYGYGERRARQIGGEKLQEVAMMFFGRKDEQQAFVFI